MLQRPGSSWGFGALLKDTSVVVLKEDTPPTNNPCRTWDSNPQPSGYDRKVPTRYPLGHDSPLINPYHTVYLQIYILDFQCGLVDKLKHTD